MKKLRDMLVCRICPGFLEMFGSVGHASIVQEETSHGAHSTRWPSMHICGVLFCCTPAACLVWSEEDPLSNHIDVFLPILRLHLDVMKQQGNTWYLQRVKARFLMSCPFCLKCFHCFVLATASFHFYVSVGWSRRRVCWLATGVAFGHQLLHALSLPRATLK